ncbi:MAG: purine-nucleoside phosphorylase, partial [Lachnospiraceae bacterium]
SLNISLREGVYVQLSGPNYETPSEIKMCRILGGDAVGMSTACEAMAANHMGIQVCGISCITNLACGMSEKELNHNEVQETATRVEAQFKQLITGIVYGIANE